MRTTVTLHHCTIGGERRTRRKEEKGAQEGRKDKIEDLERKRRMKEEKKEEKEQTSFGCFCRNFLTLAGSERHLSV